MIGNGASKPGEKEEMVDSDLESNDGVDS